MEIFRLVRISRKQVALIFEDPGYGISAEDLPHIFERFYQVAPLKENQNRGAGLGLSLAKSLIEMQRGHIQVQSQPGVGTRFSNSFGAIPKVNFQFNLVGKRNLLLPGHEE